MTPFAYYSENDPFAAEQLTGLIARGLIMDGYVDTRSIEDVTPADLTGFTQCHFFAGIGGWSYALRLAEWPDSRPVWTGSCPCQPFSAAGKGAGFADERHLWPSWFHLIRECRPATVIGEQVEAAIAHGWLDLVFDDLDQEGYATAAVCLPAASVGAPHLRQRCWWVADTASDGRQRLQRCATAQVSQDGPSETLGAWNPTGSPFGDWKKLLAESHVGRVDDGVSSGVDIRPRLRVYGNAIVPQVAAEFMRAYMSL